MDSETSTDSDTTMSSEDAAEKRRHRIPLRRRDAAELKVSMGFLAKKITTQVKTWEQYHTEHGIPLLTFDLTFGFDRDRSKLLPQMPSHVLDARETIIDSALKLLDLAAGPSKMISLALSQVQFVSALKWLLHFKIFDLVPPWHPTTYKSLADKANVPASELMRMLRMAMAYHVFSEHQGDSVRHNRFSTILARDENFLHGLPFFCDSVMPASAKIVDATIRWQGLQEENETAWNLAFGHGLSFDQHFSQHDKTSGYDRLMNVFDNGHSLLAAYWAEVVHGTINWSSMGKGALVVDLSSCSPWCWELAELFPHLNFQYHGPQEELHVMQDFVRMKDPALLTRVQFRPCGTQDDSFITGAEVYLLAGVIHRLSAGEIIKLLQRIYDDMSDNTRIIIVDSILPDPGPSTLTMNRVWQCRDMILRQLRNSGKTLGELKNLAAQAARSTFEINIESHTCRPDKTVATVVFYPRLVGSLPFLIE